jgi:hypothetical protein
LQKEDRRSRIADRAIHPKNFKEKYQIRRKLALWKGAGLQALGLSSFQGWKSFGAHIPAVSPPTNLRGASGAEEHF